MAGDADGIMVDCEHVRGAIVEAVTLVEI